MRRCVVIGEATAVPRDLYEVTTDRNAIATADLVIVDGVWFARLRPLGGLTEDPALVRYLLEHGILETGDLQRLDLDHLALAPGITRQALHPFVRELARSGRFPQPDRLQDFVIRRGIFL